MKRVIGCLFVIALLLSGCGGNEQKEITEVAEWESWTGELLNSEITTTPEGKQVIRIYINFTNNSSEGLYLYQCFGVQAYQNDRELTDVTDINGEDADTIRAIKNGQSLTGSFAFELDSQSSIEVELHSPTADSLLLAKKIYEVQ